MWRLFPAAHVPILLSLEWTKTNPETTERGNKPSIVLRKSFNFISILLCDSLGSNATACFALWNYRFAMCAEATRLD